MANVSEAQVLEALRTIIHPQSGTDIVSLRMVSGIAIRDDSLYISLDVDPDAAEAAEAVREAAEKALSRLPGVKAAMVVLTATKPKDSAAPEAKPATQVFGARHGEATTGNLAPSIGKVIAVASGKGGVGKSTTAVNLALALSELGLAVGLLDADIYGPSIPKLMGMAGQPQSLDGKTIEPMESYGVKVMSIGFLIAEDAPVVWRGPMVMGAIQQLLRDVNWGPLDVLVVDLPPGTGDAQLTLAQSVPLAGAIVVSTPQDVALLDARKGLAMFQKVAVPVLGIIENMSYFCCPACGHRTEVFSHGGAREVASTLGVPFLGEIPLDIVIRQTSDEGRPVVIAEPSGPQAAAYRSIGEAVKAGLYPA